MNPSNPQPDNDTFSFAGDDLALIRLRRRRQNSVKRVYTLHTLLISGTKVERILVSTKCRQVVYMATASEPQYFDARHNADETGTQIPGFSLSIGVRVVRYIIGRIGRTGRIGQISPMGLIGRMEPISRIGDLRRVLEGSMRGR